MSASYQLRTTKATALHDEMALTAAYQLFKESRHSRRRNRTQTRHQYETVNAITLNADLVKRLGAHRLQYGVEAVYNTVGSEANFTTPADPDAAPEPADTRYPSGGSATGTHLPICLTVGQLIKILMYLQVFDSIMPR
ncbi:MAG: hypothetical protein IPL33_21125 [Sphingobacteriales bacterium]|nr:hypothetical protein [Sphingobacteriales bacterium]